MASISGLCYSSSTLEKFTPSQLRIHCLQENRSHSPTDRASIVFSAQSVARDFPSSLSKLNSESPEAKKGLEKDPAELWRRYVDWLYHNKELGLYLDVSRVGFTDEFVAEMEPKFQAAFRAMEELEKGAIANPDEGRMVGHYWLKTPRSRRIRT